MDAMKSLIFENEREHIEWWRSGRRAWQLHRAKPVLRKKGVNAHQRRTANVSNKNIAHSTPQPNEIIRLTCYILVSLFYDEFLLLWNQ